MAQIPEQLTRSVRCRERSIESKRGTKPANRVQPLGNTVRNTRFPGPSSTRQPHNPFRFRVMCPFDDITKKLLPGSVEASSVGVPLDSIQLRPREALQLLVFDCVIMSEPKANMSQKLSSLISLSLSVVATSLTTPSFVADAIFQLSRFNLSLKRILRSVKAFVNC